MSEEIRSTISRLTGKTFEIADLGRYPVRKELVKWFMWCPEITEMREIPHVNVVWSDKDDNIYLDSMPIGDTTTWIEEEYGEKGIHRVLGMNLQDFKSPDTRTKFGEQFPKVQSRISAYEQVGRDIAMKFRVDVEIWYYGRKGIVTARLRGTVPAKNVDIQSRKKQIGVMMNALKEAWVEIGRYDARRAKGEIKRRG